MWFQTWLLLQLGAQAGVLGRRIPSWLAKLCNLQLPSRRVHSERRLLDRGKQKTKISHRMDSPLPSQTSLPLAGPAVHTSPANTPPQLRNPAPPTTSPPPLLAPVASTLPPRDSNHPPAATVSTHSPDAQTPTHSTTDPTPTTPHVTQTAVAGPPASSSKPETGGQPPVARHDQAENPPKRTAKPDATATVQAGGSSHDSAGSQGASGAPGPYGDTGKRSGREGMAAAAARNLRCLRASAVCVQPLPLRQPGRRRRHPSGFACRRVCRLMPGSSGKRLPQW